MAAPVAARAGALWTTPEMKEWCMACSLERWRDASGTDLVVSWTPWFDTQSQG
jgi:hypothetical protein